MSDLISRSKLYMNDLIRREDVLALFPINDCSDKMVGLYERVLDIPTAYDVSKVVAEIKEDKFKHPFDEDEELINSYIDRAIKAVRKGGVE